MHNLFYTYFNLDRHKNILFCGQDTKPFLVRKLAEQVSEAGFNVAVTGLKAWPYPLEGKVELCPDPLLILKQQTQGPASFIYFADRTQEGKLIPHDYERIQEILSNKEKNHRLFILAEGDEPQVQELLNKSRFAMVCGWRFDKIRECLEEPTNASKPEDRVRAYLERSQPSVWRLLNESDDNTAKYCFIGGVSSLLDENMLLPVARKWKESTGIHVLYGSIGQNRIKHV